MIPVIILGVIGYALVYTGIGNLSGGTLTGGNRQGLAASLGLSRGLSTLSGFTLEGFRQDGPEKGVGSSGGTLADATAGVDVAPLNAGSAGDDTSDDTGGSW